jgi:hypothetical protein
MLIWPMLWEVHNAGAGVFCCDVSEGLYVCFVRVEMGMELQYLEQLRKGGFTHTMHFPCCSPAVPLPCRSAKSLDCVFPI